MERNPANTGKPENARGAFRRGRVKPFLKWAGGKGQLLREIEAYYPFGPDITKYAEPFVGGGAVLFDILSRYDLEAVYISDINAELINTYRVVRDEIDGLIALLSRYQTEYPPLDTEARRAYYNRMRDRFNTLKTDCGTPESVEKAALMIFLNRTCFNGLYRVNRRGLFNVPVGDYARPLICDEENLRAASECLQPATIVCGDYRESAAFIDERTFVYFDPPYRPLTDTSSFTAYTELPFDDAQQIELAQFAEEMHRKGAKIVLSNSDPKNVCAEDDFFDSIYAPRQIRRVEAARMINRNSGARGKIHELLISNFEAERPVGERDFSAWLSGFRDSLADYGYYTDFEKVHRNVDAVRIELNILNSLVGSKNIEADFERLMTDYPQILRCVPLLLAVRAEELSATDGDGTFVYNFRQANLTAEQYKIFMRKTGLFDLLSNRIISNLVDYATGVEAGLDSNRRKNRGGHLMEALVERCIQDAGFIKDCTYFRKMDARQIKKKWNVDLSALSQPGTRAKRFDFVVKTGGMLYGVETNFYGRARSGLDEAARSYQALAREAEAVDGFTFVWFTDGKGWLRARDSLEEAFGAVKHLYNVNDLERGIIREVFR